jgi:AraC family transcriptional regulator, transcriptional activator of pobA
MYCIDGDIFGKGGTRITYPLIRHRHIQTSKNFTKNIAMNNPLFDIFSLDNLPLHFADRASAKHSQRQFEMIWLIEGEGVHIVDGTTFTLQPHHMYCVIPGMEHQLSLHPEAKGFILSFCNTFLQQDPENVMAVPSASIRRQLMHATEMSVSIDAAEEMTDLLTLLLKEKKRHLQSKSEMLHKYFRLFLDSFSRLQEIKGHPVSGKMMHKLVDRFLALVEDKFRERLTVTDYAKAVFVTPNYLNHVIKTTTGLTAREHIQQRILLEAKTELRRQGASMKQIAYHLGFDDLGHFSKFFKNTAGKNFTDYKKELIQQYI